MKLFESAFLFLLLPTRVDIETMAAPIKLTEVNYLARDFRTDIAWAKSSAIANNREAFIFALMRRGLNEAQVNDLMREVWVSARHDEDPESGSPVGDEVVNELIEAFRKEMAKQGLRAQSGLYTLTTYKNLFDTRVRPLYDDFYGPWRKEFLIKLARDKGIKAEDVNERLSTVVNNRLRVIFDFAHDQLTDRYFDAIYDYLSVRVPPTPVRPAMPLFQFTQPDFQMEAAAQQVQTLIYDPSRTTTMSSSEWQQQQFVDAARLREQGVEIEDEQEQEQASVESVVAAAMNAVPMLTTLAVAATVPKRDDHRNSAMVGAVGAASIAMHALQNRLADFRDGDEDLIDQEREEARESLDAAYSQAQLPGPSSLVEPIIYAADGMIESVQQTTLAGASMLAAANQYPAATVSESLLQSVALPAAVSVAQTTLDVITEGPAEVFEFGKAVVGVVSTIAALVAIPAVAIGIAVYVSRGGNEQEGTQGATIKF